VLTQYSPTSPKKHTQTVVAGAFAGTETGNFSVQLAHFASSRPSSGSQLSNVSEASSLGIGNEWKFHDLILAGQQEPGP
jgi:hypothetical protein